jgi:hypothetical protein
MVKVYIITQGALAEGPGENFGTHYKNVSKEEVIHKVINNKKKKNC